MTIRCGVTSLISKHILLTRFNEAARDYFSVTPLVVCGRHCGEAIEGAVLNSNVVSEAVNDVIQEDSSLRRVCAILELAILDSQIVGLSFFVAFTVNLNTITVSGIELAAVKDNVLAAIVGLRNRGGKAAAGEYEIVTPWKVRFAPS